MKDLKEKAILGGFRETFGAANFVVSMGSPDGDGEEPRLGGVQSAVEAGRIEKEMTKYPGKLALSCFLPTAHFGSARSHVESASHLSS